MTTSADDSFNSDISVPFEETETAQLSGSVSPVSPIQNATAGVLRSASVVALVTILSKILGLARDQMIAHAYGVSLVSDAYLYAFQIPSFFIVLLGGLGGPFHTATVSVLSKLLKPEERPTEKAQQITNTFLTVTGLVCAVLSVLVFLFSPWIIGLIAGNATPELKTLAANHLRWMSPLIFLGGVIGIFYGVANIYKRFFWPSFSPSAVNVTVVIWLLFWKPDAYGYSLAIATLLGGFLQVGMQLPDYFKSGFRLFPSFKLKDPDLRRMGELLFPATVGTTIGQLNIYVAMFFVSQLAPGGWTATNYGNRLIQLPIGILTIAMLVPLFPLFSRWAGEQNYEAIRNAFRDGILSLWLLSFPIMILIFLVGESSVALLFQRGAFDHHATLLVNSVLMVLSLSIIPYMLRDGITRIFYAFNDSLTPLISGVLSIGINFLFNWLLVRRYGVAGIAFSQVLVTVFNATMLSLLIRRHMPGIGFGRFMGPTLKMILASVITYAVGFAVMTQLPKLYTLIHLHELHWVALANILVTIMVVGVVYIATILLLKVELAHRLISRLQRHKA